MNPKKHAQGLAFFCDDMGKILKIVQNDLKGAAFIKTGILFPSIVERDNMGKALSFLLDVRRNQKTQYWELNINFEGKGRILYFLGAMKDDKILAVCADEKPSALQILQRMTKISPDRDIVEDLNVLGDIDSLAEGIFTEEIYFDELSRLYNELSNLQRELAKQNVELKRLSVLKNQFLGIVAHDLRNPIWMIRMYSQFLLEETADVLNEEQQNFLQTIKFHSESMQKLVDSYLDVAAIESGKLKLDLNPTDINILIKNNVAMNQMQASKKNIKLELIQKEKMPKIIIDAGKIDQVFNNLISNSIRFSLPKTKITIDVFKEHDEIRIVVKDEGVGIPKEKQKAIFEPFSGRDSQLDYGERSVGLGLFIIKKIIHEHGGRIWMESEVGEGTTFFVALPIKTE
ncbi:MAG: HAMP domain-containing histidine kinase [Candidatus Aminicenantes bacterium]|nr:HAMP domain-containing histidine kinase [Candidatus Aminicenantes bacterium]